MPVEQWSDKIWIVHLENEPGLSDDLTSVREKMMHVKPTPSVIVDFAGVTHVNSSNLSQLLRIRKECIDRDTKLRLAALSDQLWAVFLTTGLDKVFDFTEDVPLALAGLQIGE